MVTIFKKVDLYHILIFKDTFDDSRKEDSSKKDLWKNNNNDIPLNSCLNINKYIDK